MAGSRFGRSFSTSSTRSLLPKSISADPKPNSSLRSSKSDIENSRPVHPNIRVSQQQQQFRLTKRSLSESPAFRNQIASSDRRDDVSASRVVVRIRPTKEESWTLIKVSKDSLSVGDRQFTFDSVLDSNLSQEDIFQRVGVPLVRDVLSGYNTCVLSYGQTGSGKTYTMWGPPSSMLEDLSPRGEQGLAPRIFQMIFAEIQREKVKSEGKQLNYQCRCSFLEIYNGQISDLIDQSQRNLEIKDEPKSGIYVENLTEEYVDSYEDIAQILMKGLSSRKVGTTSANTKSSRSHVIFSFIIESWCKGASSRHFSITRTSRINLVDLAGAERNKFDDVSKQCMKEEKYLKKSLSRLGNVVNALTTNIHPELSDGVLHKGSCLTHLLQEALGGNAKLTVICNISPSTKDTNETMRTLRFGARAKSIKNEPVINEISEDDVNDLSDQIRLLKEELIRAKADVYQSVGSKNDYSRAWSARESLNQLRVSLNRSLLLPKLDNDEEEEDTVDEDDVKELHQELNKLHGSFNESLTKLSDTRDSVNSSFVSASCEPELMEDEKISSGETEANETDLDRSLKEYDDGTVVTTNKSTEKSGTKDSALGSSVSICPSHKSLALQEPISSESPKINTLRKSMALSSSICLRNQMSTCSKVECLRESEHNRTSLRTSKIFPGSMESLAASLQRGLEIIDNDQLNLMSRRSSVSFSFEKPCTETNKDSTSVEMLQEDKSSADIQSSSFLCPSCQQKFGNNLKEVQDGLKLSSVAVDGASNSNETATKGADPEMEGVTDKELELENLCAEQATKIEQLTRLLERYKHQTENEITPLEGARNGDDLSSANEDQLLNHNEIENHPPEIIKESYEVKQVQEDSHKTNFDIREKEALLNEIENLKSKLQSCKPASLTMSTDKLRSSLLARKSIDFKKITAEELEKERLRWTEMESEWISLTDELRVDIETQHMRAEKAEAQLKLEKLRTEEQEDALHRAVIGHARFVEHYTELQEKYNNLAGKHKAMIEWITEVKRAVAKAGEKGRGSRFAKSLAAELSASRAGTERERDLLKKENRSLKIQLRDTAEAVHAAGEMLVRLREAEQAASVAEENFKETQEENEKLRKKMEKLKRKHKTEMITMKQYLNESRLPESALKTMYQESVVEEHNNSNSNNRDNDQAWRVEFGAIYQEHY